MLESPKKNINHIELVDNVSIGNVRQREILQQPFDKAAILPRTVTLRDMDDQNSYLYQSLNTEQFQ